MKYFRHFKMRYLIVFLCFTISPLCSEIPASSLKYMPPMDVIYHPVSTQNSEAQKSFDRGLTYIFAFNHDIAFRLFEKAAQLDPNLAMAFWGMALALGQNINDDVTPENEIKCYNYIQQALKLAPKASPSEQNYISALSVRYTNDPKADLIPLRFKYRDAMRKLVQAYPEDLDASTLFAESILDVDPWKWWTSHGKPKEGINEAVDILESVLKRNPYHIGANHYYIHAFEESTQPERALMSAHRLERLLPESGHLLHMPCHIFMLVGDYESALKTNTKAIEQDREYMRKNGIMNGGYPLHYLPHNLYVMARIYMLMEDYPNAIKTSFELTQLIEPYLEAMPHLASRMIVPMEIYLYFHKWEEILAYNMPTENPTAQSYWHYSRAVAYIAMGDLASAEKEKELMLNYMKKLKPENTMANSTASEVMNLAEVMLEASFAQAQKKSAEYIDILKKGIKIQENLAYNEPPPWYVPVEQILGFALLEQRQYIEAEKAFKNTLNKLQRNGRALYGLWMSLKGQGRTIDAYWVEREMMAASRNMSQN